MLILALIFGCNSQEEVFNPENDISDEELLQLIQKFRILTDKNIDFSKYQDYASYQDFLQNSTEEIRKQFIQDMSLSTEIPTAIRKIFHLQLTDSEIEDLKIRFFVLLHESSNALSRVRESCYDACWDASWGVWWDVFHINQDNGADMYEANTYANIAQSWFYAGCSYGCNQRPE